MMSISRTSTENQKKRVTLYTQDVKVDVGNEDAISSNSELADSFTESGKGVFSYVLSDLKKKEYTLEDIQKDSDDPNEDSESSSGKRAVFELEKKISAGPNFFEVLGSLPNIDEISVDSEVEKELERFSKVSRRSRYTEEEGQFTDPLTGAVLLSESISQEDEAAVSLQFESESESSGILAHALYMPEIPKEKIIEKKDLAVDIDLEHFFDMPAPSVIQVPNYEELLKQEIQRQVEEDTRNLLHTIIDKVVTKCEHFDRRRVMNNALDKEVLIEVLMDRIAELKYERLINIFLGNKCKIYFHQKGMRRYLSNDKIHNNNKLGTKYREELFVLDKMLDRKQKLEEKFSDKVDGFRLNVENKQETLARRVEEFEELVFETLTTNRSDDFRQYVASQLAYIRTVRAEIEAARVEFIERKREDVLLRKRLVKANQIAENITIDRVELLEAEIQTLDKKLEAINAEIAKKQREFSTTLHFRAHLAEKMEILNISVNNLTHQLDRVLTTREELKNEIHEITKERLAIRREYNELIDSSGGLLNKPLLLDDFDNTSRKLAQIKRKNKKGREKIARTVKFIANLELVCEKNHNAY